MVRVSGAKRFVLVLLPPKHRQHMRVFEEIAEVVAGGLHALGYSTTTREREFLEGERHVVFAPHLLQPKHAAVLPSSSILYNFEPLHPLRENLMTLIADFAPRFTLWDYSAANVEMLRAQNRGSKVQHVPFGYTPALTRVTGAPDQDIDVLFYGSLNERRERALDAIRARGLGGVAARDVYGSERDALIARAKVVLNVHYYDDARNFESPRIVDLLANRKAVVTERKDGVAIDADLAPLIVTAPYEALAEACWQLVTDERRRRELETAAFEGIRQRDESQILRQALKDLEQEYA